MEERWGSNYLLFTYDEQGRPYSVNYNGGQYYYVLNQQGDVIRIVAGDGSIRAEYRYNAWGEVEETENSAWLGKINPLRYRGYYYDSVTGFYYVSSRYYSPEIGRFISADTTDILGASSDLYDKNLYAYCDNNPIVRKDESGALWITTFVVTAGTGFLTRWAGDIIGNIRAGERGQDIFKMTSSKGEYLAAMTTAFIPGSGIRAALVRNIVSEAIVSVERHITGEGNSLQLSIKKVFIGTAIDTGVEAVSKRLLVR